MSAAVWKNTAISPGLEKWTLRTPNVKIVVQRGTGVYKGWFYTCHEVHADETPLRAETLEVAEVEAAQAVWQLLQRAVEDLDGIVAVASLAGA